MVIGGIQLGRAVVQAVARSLPRGLAIASLDRYLPAVPGLTTLVGARNARNASILLILALACRGDPKEFPTPTYGRDDGGARPRDAAGTDFASPDAGSNPPPDSGSPDSPQRGRPDSATTGSRDAGIGEREVLSGAPDHILFRGGTIVTADPDGEITTIEGGELYVNGNTIDCVSPTTCDAPGDATVIRLGSNDKIYPGLIDPHNHPHYNFCPILEHAATYVYNGQWRGSDEYAEWGDTYYDPNDDLVCEKYQYGFALSLLGAATAIQGVGLNRRCFRQETSVPLLGRMIDSIDGIGPDHVRTWALGIGSVPDEDAQAFCDSVDSGEEDRVFIHIGEGRRGNTSVEREWETLMGLANGCLVDSGRAGNLVLIHGNFTRETLGEIAALGDSPEERPVIVWSPSSNTDLYGRNAEATLDVPYALELGIRVALGPDWKPSHGTGEITEMNIARRFADDFFPAGSVTDEEIFRMATLNAAYAAGLQDPIGRLEVGMLADIAIVKGGTLDPFEPAYLGDVAGVMIGGKLYYGEPWLMEASSFDPAACEEISVCGIGKTICIPDTVDGDPVSFSRLETETFLQSSGSGTTGYVPNPIDTLPNACGPE